MSSSHASSRRYCYQYNSSTMFRVVIKYFWSWSWIWILLWSFNNFQSRTKDRYLHHFFCNWLGEDRKILNQCLSICIYMIMNHADTFAAFNGPRLLSSSVITIYPALFAIFSVLNSTIRMCAMYYDQSRPQRYRVYTSIGIVHILLPVVSRNMII